MDESLEVLIAEAEALGLPHRDVANASSLLRHAEYGCAFDIIVQQLYEHDINISSEYYQLIKSVAERMKLPEQDFLFLKTLIK